MKKLLAMFLTLTLVLGMSLTAMAADTYEDVSSIDIIKVFKDVNDSQKSPAETFSFSALTCESVTDAADGVTKDNAPVPTIGTVAFAEGEATVDGAEKQATITLPKYTSVGIYTYKFKESVPTTKTAGVTYNEGDLYLVVTVIEQNGKVRVAAVHCEGSHEPNADDKTDEFENTYESGTLAVSKTVTGNMGDQSKLFDVTITLTAPANETVQSTITCSGGSDAGNSQTIAGGWTGDKTVSIKVKHDETVTLTNIPEGVTWKVEEADYTSEDYKAAVYSKQTDSIAAGDADTCQITNTKEAEIDTGINMDSLPYIVMIAVVVIAAAAFFMKRRGSAEE